MENHVQRNNAINQPAQHPPPQIATLFHILLRFGELLFFIILTCSFPFGRRHLCVYESVCVFLRGPGCNCRGSDGGRSVLPNPSLAKQRCVCLVGTVIYMSERETSIIVIAAL